MSLLRVDQLDTYELRIELTEGRQRQSPAVVRRITVSTERA